MDSEHIPTGLNQYEDESEHEQENETETETDEPEDENTSEEESQTEEDEEMYNSECKQCMEHREHDHAMWNLMMVGGVLLGYFVGIAVVVSIKSLQCHL